MGFLKRFRKSYGEFKEEKEKEKRELAKKEREEAEARQMELEKKEEEQRLRENSSDSSYLESLIRSGSKEISIDRNIFFSSHIKIDEDDIIIDGNDRVFDGNGNSSFFLIEGKNITIRNVNFRNGHSNALDSGAVVISKGTSCKFIGCIFEDIFSDSQAAIGNLGGKLDIHNSNFIHCYSEGRKISKGGAICNFGDAVIRECKFFECSLDDNSLGGAIYNEGKIDASSLSFYTNSAPNGGAIFNSGNLILKDSHFADNSSKLGGAILNHEILEVYDTKFFNNHAPFVGAIANNGKMTLIGNVFEENHGAEGGAIGAAGHSTIENSIFKDNSSTTKGGAIFVKDICNATFTECKFENNRSGTYDGKESHSGLSICNDAGHVNLIGCEFSEHHSLEKQIIVNSSSLEVFDSTFQDNNSQMMIFNDSESDMLISDSKFINNNISKTLIENKGKLASITRALFEGNVFLEDDPYDIFNYGFLKLNDIKLDDSIYNDGKISLIGLPKSFEDKISTTPKGSLQFIEVSEDDQSADSGEDKSHDSYKKKPIDFEEDGSAYNSDRNASQSYNFSYLNNLIQEIKNKQVSGEETNREIILDHDIILEDDEAIFYEGGIVLDLDGLTINGNNFTISGANASRIFIIAAKDITLKDINFVHGFADKNYQGIKKTGGGVILANSFSDYKIENCRFDDNNSFMYGGALYNRGHAEISKSEFSNNTANRGGAINNDGLIRISSCNFDGNHAKIDYGGAIANANIMELDDISLSDNSAYRTGDAIINCNELKIANSRLSKNYGGLKRGSHIEFRGYENLTDDHYMLSWEKSATVHNSPGSALDVIDTCFKENSGIAIKNSKDCRCNVSSSKFLSGEASAILSLGMLDVDNSLFESNNAKMSGGAIYSMNRLTVSNSIFDGNTCPSEGGAIYHAPENEGGSVSDDDGISLSREESSNGIIVKDCEFMNNRAEHGGGAIKFIGDYEFDGLKFENNEGAYANDIKVGHENFFKAEEVEEEEDEQFDSWGHDFKYLDDLIHSGVKKISLDDDVVITYEELSNYPNGIKIDVDDLEIEGNNKTITAQGKTRIFEVFGRNISLKDITLKNGASDEGGALYVHEDSHLKMRNVFIIESNAESNGGAIYNKGKLEFRNVSCIDNIAQENGGAIYNDKTGDMDFTLCGFYTNEAGENGGGIYDIGPMEIKKNSRVFRNKAKKGGGIYLTNLEAVIKDKRGNSKIEVPVIKMSDVGFVSNTAEDSDGALACQDEKKLKLKKCKFNTNSPKGRFD